MPLFLDLLRSETANDPSRMVKTLRGLRAFQAAPRAERPPPAPAIMQVGRAMLRDHGGTGRPILVVPSLINPPDVLDLAPANSLMRHLAGCGGRALLLDWGTPSAEERALDLAAHVETMLLPMIDRLVDRWGEPPLLVGYCLGGTMALAAAALRETRGIALLASPWHFDGFSPEARDRMVALWTQAAGTAAAIGLLPMEVLQAGFWQLDPARTVRKYEDFADLDPAGPAAASFIMLEDWANSGPPLTEAAARQLCEGFFGRDDTGQGRWRVGGEIVRPDALGCPILEVTSTRDRIVPHATALGIGDRLDLDLGHVGMVVGSRARRALWEPLGQWVSRALNS